MTQVIEKALPIVATALGGRLGVDVRVGGDAAYTDGTTIVVPSLPLEGGERLVTRAYGFIGHEAAHVRYTDFGQMRAAILSLKKFGGFFQHIFNVLEDVRIEKTLAADYPGMGKILANLVTDLVTNEPESFSPPKEGDSPGVVLMSWLLITRRCYVLKQDALAPAAKTAEKVFQKTFSKSFQDEMAMILKELPFLPSDKITGTRKALEMSKDILDAFLKEQGNKNDQDDGQEGSQGDQDGQGNQDDQGDQDDQGNQESQGGQGGQGGQGDQDGQGNQDDQGDQGSQGNQGGGQNPKRKGRQKKKGRGGAAAAASSIPSKKDLEGLATDLGKIAGKSLAEAIEEMGEGMGRGEELLSSSLREINRGILGRPYCDEVWARAIAGPVRQRLRVLAEGQKRVVEYPSIRGRLNGRLLARTTTGNPKVFTKKIEGKAVNAAIHLLVDCSGSMSGVLYQTGTAIRAVAEAAASMKGVNLGITGFTDDFVIKMKAHGESMASARERIGAYAMGGTPLEGALVKAGAYLLACKEEKKVLIVFTDGSPSNGTQPSKRVVDALRSKGVWVYAIGLDVGSHDFVEEIFGDFHENIKSADETADALFRATRRGMFA